MTPQHVNIVFQIIAFVFAISVHESAHAWMANLRGDPTARMLGRITLNPIKHIDPVGTVLMPLIAAFTPHMPMIGWAKPTPVDTRNFRKPVLDDILTSVVGPVSNLALAAMATVLLVIIKLSSPIGRQVIDEVVRQPYSVQSQSTLVPFCLLFYWLMVINILLAIFNLIPVPPLDGSHVLRHFLPEPVRLVYDRIGVVALLILFLFGGGFLGAIFDPVQDAFRLLILNA